MREIEFKGKRVDNNEWIYGCYVQDTMVSPENLIYLDDCRIKNVIVKDGIMQYVKPETVSQYTGLKNKNGIKIYENDQVYDAYDEVTGYIKYDEGKFYVTLENVIYDLWEIYTELEIIGNLYEEK